MTARQIYECAKCGETEFKRTDKQENETVYDSIEHVITDGGSFGVVGTWDCLKCGESIPLRVLHNMFRGVKYKGFAIIDCEAKLTELEARLKIPLDVAEEGKWEEED